MNHLERLLLSTVCGKLSISHTLLPVYVYLETVKQRKSAVSPCYAPQSRWPGRGYRTKEGRSRCQGKGWADPRHAGPRQWSSTVVVLSLGCATDPIEGVPHRAEKLAGRSSGEQTRVCGERTDVYSSRTQRSARRTRESARFLSLYACRTRESAGRTRLSARHTRLSAGRTQRSARRTHESAGRTRLSAQRTGSSVGGFQAVRRAGDGEREGLERSLRHPRRRVAATSVS